MRRFPNDKLVFKLLVLVMTLMVVIDTVRFSTGFEAHRRYRRLTWLAGHQHFLDLELGVRELCQPCGTRHHPLADEATPFAIGKQSSSARQGFLLTAMLLHRVQSPSSCSAFTRGESGGSAQGLAGASVSNFSLHRASKSPF